MSPAGAGAYVSMLVPAPGAGQVAVLPLLAGVALCEALNRHLGRAAIDSASLCRLKWPNDLVVGSRKIGGITVPHFQVILGGMWRKNAGSFGLAMAAVPSRNIPQVVTRLTDRFVQHRQGNESFQDFIARTGKREIKSMLEDLTVVPAYEEDSSFYSDWGAVREFTIKDMGKGECAGEVISKG